MNMNQRRPHGVAADRAIDIPVIPALNAGPERPAAPLSLMDRIAVWLSSPPKEVGTVKRDSISKYLKGYSRPSLAFNRRAHCRTSEVAR